MAISTIKSGSGLTAREAIDIESLTPEEVLALLPWPAGAGPFEGGTSSQAEFVQTILTAVGKPPFETGSIGDLARQFLHLRRATMHSLAAGRNEVAALQAFEAGLTLGNLEMKIRAEPSWLKGEKQTESARAGHEAVHGTDAEKKLRWRRMAVETEALIAAGEKKTVAYATVAERHGCDAKTVRRAIKRAS